MRWDDVPMQSIAGEQRDTWEAIPRRGMVPWLIVLTFGLYWAVLPGHLLDAGVSQRIFVSLHTLIELAAVLVSLTVGLTANYTLGDTTGRRAPALTASFLLIAVLDLLHLASYAGMPDLVSPNSPHKSILFWLLARWVAALTLLFWAAGWRIGQAPNAGFRSLAFAVAFAGVGALAAVSLIAPDQLPAMFVPGVGLTPLKRSLEFAVVGIQLAALLLQWRRVRAEGPRLGEDDLRLALWVATLGEGFFILFSERSTDLANMTGHLYKVAAYALLYRSMFVDRIRRPFVQLDRALVEAEQREHKYRSLLELAPEGVVVTDREGRILIVNRALEQMFGCRREQLIGQPMEQLLPPSFRERHRTHRQRYMEAPGWPAMRGRGGLRGLHADGHEFDIEVALGLDQGGGEPRLTAYVADVSQRRAQERELEFRASHDALTGLPNRWLFVDRLGQAAHAGELLLVAVLDIDGFKAVNDSQGTPAGDALLRDVAMSLSASLTPGAMLARLGSDEFALLCPLQGDQDEAEADRLVRALQEQLRQHGRSACIGWTCRHALPAAPPDELLAEAQLALQAAKQAGAGQMLTFTGRMGERSRRERQIEQRLRLALASEQLVLHYQPQVGVVDGKVHGYEALLRWEDAELGMVSPAEFVPVAERAGLVGAIGAWVQREACRQLAAWRDQGFDTVVAINLSPLQFGDAQLAENVLRELQRHGLPSRCLVVEITESAVMDDPVEAAAQLRRLRQAGLAVHLDDFGTGHSSLAWLKNFPIQVIKIDRSFIRDMEANASDEAIVRVVIGLAHHLGCRLIAEGVERPAQLERLRELGCEEYQGWLYSKALPPDEARAMADG